jgi:hypothetical protein
MKYYFSGGKIEHHFVKGEDAKEKMKYYFSGINHWKKELGIWDAVLRACPWRLQSCYPGYMRSTHLWAQGATSAAPGEIEMMFDSGAFTAWGKGEVIKLDDLMRAYDDIIEKYEHGLKAVWLINLDIIPGARGVTAPQCEIDAAMLQSDANFEVLQKRYGHRVLPVYHQNEPVAQLHRISQSADYICVSPRNDLPEGDRIRWSLEAHDLLPKGKKTHGLATTGRNMLTRVPWYSADSASWIFCGANGGIMVLIGNKFKIVTVSAANPKAEEIDGHYDTMPRAMQQVIEERVANHGMTMEQLRDPKGYGWRMIFNAREIVQFCSELEHVAPATQEPLFEL